MQRRTLGLATIGLILSLFGTPNALAAGQRTFVASWGDDLNPCSLQLPCRSFAPAIAAANAAGEVIVLDSAGYGPFTVTKSISVIAPPGVYAGMSPTAGVDGVVIAAGVGDKVVLRGLAINGQGGDRGIVVNSGGEVHIEQCMVSNMAQNAIEINGGGEIHVRTTIVRSNAANGLSLNASTTEVRIVDSQFARNSGNGIRVVAGTLDASRIAVDGNASSGVIVSNPPAGTPAAATLADSAVSDNGSAGAAVQTNTVGSSARLSVVRSTSARNGTDGYAATTAGGSAFLSVSDSAAVENGYSGLNVSGGGVNAVITRSTLVGNATYDYAQSSSAVLRSTGNNTQTGSAFTGMITPLSSF